MTDKPNRVFVVDADEELPVVLTAKTPREAAVRAFNGLVDAETATVEVFERGRGKRYVRQATAVPAGKAE